MQVALGLIDGLAVLSVGCWHRKYQRQGEAQLMLTGTAASDLTLDKRLAETQPQTGETLLQISNRSPMLILFLRHCGCTFAREALSDLAKQRERIEQLGIQIVIVHMTTEAEATELFARFNLVDLPRVSDPEQALYQAMELNRGSFWQVFGPKMWWRAISALISGNSMGIPKGDLFQLPGVFLIHQGKIVKAFRPETSSDRMDFQMFTTGEVSKPGHQ